MAGIYIHIPFCRNKCTYCDFHFSTKFENYRLLLIHKISEEIKWRKNEIKEKIRSVYFGGGTPSILNSTEFDILFKSLKTHFKIAENAEITLEANPEDVHEKNLSVWKKHGVNRLSIGVQTLSNSHLKWMNRVHSASKTIQALETCFKFGFFNISVDFIYGLPGINTFELEQDVREIMAFPITHVSAYILTIEKGTKLNHEVNRGLIQIPNDEIIKDQYGMLCALLKQFGFHHYEVSNFSKPGFESIHNSSYWGDVSYLGVGPSAHSYMKNIRRWNVSNNIVYIDSNFKTTDWYEKESLSKIDQWNELFLTGFRTNTGVSKIEINTFGGFNEEEKKILRDYLKKKIIIENKLVYFISEPNWLLADKISSDFFRINK